jgi:hypothetical protein
MLFGSLNVSSVAEADLVIMLLQGLEIGADAGRRSVPSSTVLSRKLFPVTSKLTLNELAYLSDDELVMNLHCCKSLCNMCSSF